MAMELNQLNAIEIGEKTIIEHICLDSLSLLAWKVSMFLDVHLNSLLHSILGLAKILKVIKSTNLDDTFSQRGAPHNKFHALSILIFSS